MEKPCHKWIPISPETDKRLDDLILVCNKRDKVAYSKGRFLKEIMLPMVEEEFKKMVIQPAVPNYNPTVVSRIGTQIENVPKTETQDAPKKEIREIYE